MSAFFWIPYQSNTYPKEQKFPVHSLLQVLRKATIIMHRNLLYATFQMVFLRLKVLILISATVQ